MKLKKDIFLLIIITACFTVCFSTLACLTGKADLLPNVVELNRLQGNEGISFEDLNTINQTLGRQNISLSGENSNAVVEGASDAKIVLVNENFFSCYGIKASVGSLFDSAVIESCDPLAVISEQTAMELFMTTSVLGNEIRIAGEPYRIAGLYDSEVGFWEKVAKDTSERVYIPYTSFYGGEHELVDAITYEESQYTADYYNNLKSYFGRKINGYTKLDYELEKSLATQFYSIFQWLLVVILCCYLFVFAYRAIHKIWREAQIIREDNYFISFLKELIKRNWLAMLAIAAELTSVGILLSITRLEVSLPTAMIPADNVFDIKYYLDYFLQYAQSNNVAHYAANGFYKRMLENTIIACAALLPICILLFSSVVRRTAVLGRKNKWRLAEYFIWLLVVSSFLLGICYLAGCFYIFQATITSLCIGAVIAAASLNAVLGNKDKVKGELPVRQNVF